MSFTIVLSGYRTEPLKHYQKKNIVEKEVRQSIL